MLKKQLLLSFFLLASIWMKASNIYTGTDSIRLNYTLAFANILPDTVYSQIHRTETLNGKVYATNTLIYALETGTDTINIYNSNNVQIAMIAIYVLNNIPIQTLTISHDTILLKEGDSLQIEYNITPANATINELQWSVSQPSVVSISQSGMLLAKTFGISQIRLTALPQGISATKLVRIIKDCHLEPPTVTSNISICMNDRALFLASSNNVTWYSDIGLTLPVGSGMFFSPQYDTAGTYQFYVAQTSNGCKSEPSPARLIVHSKPEPPAIAVFKTEYLLSEVLNTDYFPNQYSWYTKPSDEWTWEYTGNGFPLSMQNIGFSEAKVAAVNEFECESEPIILQCDIIDNPRLFLAGTVHSPSPTNCTVQLLKASTKQLVTSQENVNGNFELSIIESGSYVLRAIPFDNELYETTYFGNTNSMRNAYVFHIDSLNYGDLDINLVLKEDIPSFINNGRSLNFPIEVNAFTLNGSLIFKETVNSNQELQHLFSNTAKNTILQVGSTSYFCIRK